MSLGTTDNVAFLRLLLEEGQQLRVQLARGSATYVAFLHPTFGTALLVGVAVVTLLHLLLRP
ncbi:MULTISPECIES: hypothetical protein [unclassified Streptomyces]|uniref:hypothetical protein n=1 Tax=unclassified Streptomyces TaxID=2593676 RepID=UPI002DD94F36|nr:hypothetical protein [Streptomyces sp. NBC_01445]WSE11451.1 hypothetical protein OG574_50565 [Streptomyces sp. NBC_01445]